MMHGQKKHQNITDTSKRVCRKVVYYWRHKTAYWGPPESLLIIECWHDNQMKIGECDTYG